MIQRHPMPMKRLKALLALLGRGSSLEESWRAAGYSTRRDAAEALESLARSLDEPAVCAAPATKGRGGLNHAILHVDGASRGNPGPSAVGVIVHLPTGEELFSAGRKIGRATNNVAEYRAVIEGLKLARELGARRITVRLDSELVVKQLNGVYRIKNPELELLAREVAAEARHFPGCSFEHVPREENREADRLANEALGRVVDP
jgi:ribonuclease HI